MLKHEAPDPSDPTPEPVGANFAERLRALADFLDEHGFDDDKLQPTVEASGTIGWHFVYAYSGEDVDGFARQIIRALAIPADEWKQTDVQNFLTISAVHSRLGKVMLYVARGEVVQRPPSPRDAIAELVR